MDYKKVLYLEQIKECLITLIFLIRKYSKYDI